MSDVKMKKKVWEISTDSNGYYIIRNIDTGDAKFTFARKAEALAFMRLLEAASQ